MKRPVILAIASVAILAACDGFKEAMSAHQDVVARAGGQELSVTRLSELLGNSKVPLQKEVAKAVVDLWVSYQLLGRAAANGDSLADARVMDDAMWAQLSEARMKKFYDLISKTWSSPADDAANAARYAQGEMLAARHILIGAPAQGLSTAARDSIRRVAEGIRARTTAANFAAMAKQYSMDPGSKDKGGLYPAFPKGTMVGAFEKALLSLKPGEVSGLVQTDFGYHIIYRPQFSEVAAEMRGAMDQRGAQVAESTYMARLETSGKVVLKENAAAAAKVVAKDLTGSRDDRTVIATSLAGELTAGRLAQWIAAYPPRAQIAQQIGQAPDSMVKRFVQNVIRNELLLRAADSAKVQPDSADVANARMMFRGSIAQAWTGLGVQPAQLADSGRSTGERERVASGRIERYLDALLNEGPVQFVAVPEPVAAVLREKYESKVMDAGLDRAVERAAKIRQVADSTRASQQPKSQVPMGPMGPQGQMPPMQAPMQPPMQGPPQAAPAPAPRP